MRGKRCGKQKDRNIIVRKLRESQRRKLLAGLSVFLSFIIVLSVAVNLMQPVNTMTTICGKEEHTHSDACYTQVLVCAQAGEEGHEHTADCYRMELTCGKEEHVHTERCYPQAESEPVEETPSETQTPAPEAEPVEADPTETPAAPADPAEETPAPPDPEQPTAEPVFEPTAEPTAGPTPEPTPIPAVKVESLLVNPGTVLPGETATWTFVAANASELRYRLVSGGNEIAAGALSVEETTYAYTPTEPGDYTFELTAVGADGKTDARTSELHVSEVSDLAIKVTADQRAVLGGAEASFTITSPAAGAEGVEWQITVKQGDTVIYEAKEYHSRVSVTTKRIDEVTDIVITVRAKDNTGRSAEATATIRGRVHRRLRRERRPRLDRRLRDPVRRLAREGEGPALRQDLPERVG